MDYGNSTDAYRSLCNNVRYFDISTPLKILLNILNIFSRKIEPSSKMSKMKQEPGSCIQCIEYIMYALNVLFFVSILLLLYGHRSN